MLCADQIAQTGNSFVRQEEITEFVLAIKGGRIPDDVIVDVVLVDVRGDNEGVVSFQKAGSKFVANAIRFFRRYFSREE